MKFLTSLDVNTFLAEVKAFNKIGTVDESYEPTNEELGLFIKSRAPLMGRLKNSKQSSAQKANWRQNRTTMMKGIKAFHKSTEGKRFHRRLGRFLSTRLLRPKLATANKSESAYNALLVKQAYLKGLNSAKQHLFVELEYFHQLEEQVDLELFITDHAIPMFRSLELKVLNDKETTIDEMGFLIDIVSPNAIFAELSEKSGKTFAEIKEMWNAIVCDLRKEKITNLSENYYDSIIEALKKNLEK